MVRNIVVLGGNSHPQLVESICGVLGIPACNRILGKFSSGESRCEIQDSVRGKDVYIIQTGFGGNGAKVNDHFMDLCIMISACKTGSARRVTAVLPLFPYSRQPDLPYKKSGAPLFKTGSDNGKDYTFDSVPATPAPSIPRSVGLTNATDLAGRLAHARSATGAQSPIGNGPTNGENYFPSNGVNGGGANGANGVYMPNGANGVNGTSIGHHHSSSVSSTKQASFTKHDYENLSTVSSFQAKPGYKQWVAQAGTLVANLLTCAGADHVITMDLHDPQVQGFFDVPVDNLYGRPLLKRYILQHIPNYKDAVIISPDAGGAKRATAIADGMGMDFALIHKERRPTKITERQNASMMLVGDVSGRVCILIDDIVDTGNTITRAAKLLKKEGASRIYALVTHGVFSGEAVSRIGASALDKVVVTNSVPQQEHKAALGSKLEVLDIAPIFGEAIRRVHHGESISVLFNYD